MIYLVTYDLNRPGQNYPNLYTALRMYTHMRDTELDSVWFIQSTADAMQIYNHLAGHIDRTDRIFITRIRQGEYSGWLNKNLQAWIALNAR